MNIFGKTAFFGALVVVWLAPARVGSRHRKLPLWLMAAFLTRHLGFCRSRAVAFGIEIRAAVVLADFLDDSASLQQRS